MAKVSRLEKKLDDCFKSGDYYEAHQIYRTLYYRMCSQKDYETLKGMLYSGAIKLIQVNEPTSAVDLAELFIDVLQKSNTPVSEDILDKFAKLFELLPSTLEKDTSAEGHKTDRRSHFLSLALKWTMGVGENKRQCEQGHPLFHERVATLLWREKNFFAAKNHFLLSSNLPKIAEFLVDFQQKCGNDSDIDILIAQSVFQLLCNNKPRSAYIVFKKYCLKHSGIKSEPPYKYSLLNFIWLLMFCVQSKKVEYFTVLIERYQGCIAKDPSYRLYLDKIGQIYFGLPPPNKQGGSALIGSLLKGLLGSPSQSEQERSAQKYVEDESEQGVFFDSFDSEADFLKAMHTAEVLSPIPSAPPPKPQQNIPNAVTPPQAPPGRTDDMDLD